MKTFSILDVTSPQQAYSYAFQRGRKLTESELKTMEDMVLPSAMYSYQFAMNIPGANVSRLLKSIVKDGDALIRFARNINLSKNNISLSKLEDEILFDLDSVVLLAQHIRYTNKYKLHDAVLSSPMHSFKFARDVDFTAGAGHNISIKTLQEAVLPDPMSSYLFAKHIRGADIKKLENAIIRNTKKENYNSQWAYYFAIEMPGANVNDLTKVMSEEFLQKYNEHIIRDIIE